MTALSITAYLILIFYKRRLPVKRFFPKPFDNLMFVFNNKKERSMVPKPATPLFTVSLLISILFLSLISVTAQKPFIHPGITNSKAELDFIKSKVNAGAEPWTSGYNKMMTSKVSSLSYVARPCTSIGFDSCNGPIREDSASAYSHALQYYIKGNKANADKAVEILNAWADKNKDINPRNSSDRGCLVSSWGFHRMVAGAEIIRASYPGWSQADITKFVNYLNRIFHRFSECHSGGNNHDVSGRMTELMVAIFIDDRGKYETALGKTRDLIRSYIMNPNGCCDESSRDQAHAMMGFGFLAEAAEAAWHQGDDIYSAHDNRIYHSYELHAKYNLGNSVSGCSMNSQFRGSVGHTIWEYAYNHYHNRKGMPMPWTEQYIMKKMRPEGLVDKELPWGTLTYANLGNLDNTPPSTPSLTFNLQLASGWNLISLPVLPDNRQVASVLSPINGKYAALYAFDGNQYSEYIPGESSNSLTQMEAGRGYWIYMDSGATLELKGTAASGSVALKQGWNLVGYNSTKASTVESALGSLKDSYTVIYAYDTSANNYRGSSPGELNDLKQLEPGKGYWIYLSSPMTWTLP
jgi:hypothetical protein